MADKRIRFYADVHIAAAVVRQLRDRGVDVVRGEDVTSHEAADLEHLRAAHQQGRVLVSKDADFQALHRQGIDHSGIAFFQQKAGVGYMVSQLLLMYDVCSGEDMLQTLGYL